MKTYLLILPIAVLVTYRQLIVKLRTNFLEPQNTQNFSTQLLRFLSDPVIVSAYIAALFASFAWLYIVTKLPLTVAFPIYIGANFVLVLLCGRFFLSEDLTATKLVAVLLILLGIVLVGSSDA